MRYKWIFIVLGLMVWIGCNDASKTLTPTSEPEFWYSVPQGKHDYDARIVDWHDKCGFFILYKFEPKDVYFAGAYDWTESYADTIYQEKNYTLGLNAIQEGDQIYLVNEDKYYKIGEHIVDGLIQKCVINDYTVTVGFESVIFNGVSVEQANGTYVNKQLAWIEELCLNFYSPSWLKQAIPLKIILGKNLSLGGDGRDYILHNDCLIFSHGDESIDVLSNGTKNTVKFNVNRWILIDQIFKQIYSALKEDEEFFSCTNYSRWTASTRPSTNEFYSLGVVECYSLYSMSNAKGNPEVLRESDLKNYLYMIINNSSVKLNKEPANGNYNSSNCEGILNEKKDKNGLITTKYTILVEKLKELGIDIQGIGNLYN